MAQGPRLNAHDQQSDPLLFSNFGGRDPCKIQIPFPAAPQPFRTTALSKNLPVRFHLNPRPLKSLGLCISYWIHRSVFTKDLAEKHPYRLLADSRAQTVSDLGFLSLAVPPVSRGNLAGPLESVAVGNIQKGKAPQTARVRPMEKTALLSKGIPTRSSHPFMGKRGSFFEWGIGRRVDDEKK